MAPLETILKSCRVLSTLFSRLDITKFWYFTEKSNWYFSMQPFSGKILRLFVNKPCKTAFVRLFMFALTPFDRILSNARFLVLLYLGIGYGKSDTKSKTKLYNRSSNIVRVFNFLPRVRRMKSGRCFDQIVRVQVKRTFCESNRAGSDRWKTLEYTIVHVCTNTCLSCIWI